MDDANRDRCGTALPGGIPDVPEPQIRSCRSTAAADPPDHLSRVGDERRRGHHLELGTRLTEGHQHPVQRLGGHPQTAQAIVDLFDRDPRPDSGADHRAIGMDQRLDLMSGRQVLNASSDKLGGIIGRERSWQELRPGTPRSGEAIETEAAPVGAVHVPGDQVPPPTEQDQPVGLHPPVAVGSFAVV